MRTRQMWRFKIKERRLNLIWQFAHSALRRITRRSLYGSELQI